MTRTSRMPFLLAAALLAVDAQAQRKKKRPKPPPRKKQPAGLVRPVGRIVGFSGWVTDVAASPDGRQFAAGSDGQVKLIDVKTRTVTATLRTRPGFIRALAFSPNGKLLAVGGYQSLRLWDPTTKKVVKDLDGHTGQVTGVAFSSDGKRLVSSSHDETVRLWDVASGKQIKTLGEFEYPVNGVAFSPDDKWIATASGDEYRVTRPGIVKVWNVATGREKTWTGKDEKGNPVIVRLVEHEKAANSVAFTPDGHTLLSTSFDEKVNTYDLKTGKAFGFFDGHGRPTNDAVLTSDGSTVISAAGGRAKKRYLAIAWNRADGDPLAEMKGHRGPVTSVAISPDDKTVITGGKDKTVVIWDASRLAAKLKKNSRDKPVKARRPEVAAKPANGLRSGVERISASAPVAKTLRVGIIGLDTSHAVAFTRALNDEKAKPDIANCRVVAAYPRGSPDIVSSTSRVPKYTKQVRALGVKIVDSIPELVKRVDVVLLETNDGRPHLAQVLPVFRAGKPVFIDKPIAGSLADAVAIFQAAKKYKTPVFSSSSLRYMPGAQRIRRGAIGKVTQAEAWSPAHLEKTHPDLFWYGIHGVEALFTMMGTGCESVKRTRSTADMDEVVGFWDGEHKGKFRGYRKGGQRGYGGSAKGTKGELSAGKYAGYRPLVVDIVKFFRTGKAPVSPEETLEIYAFMEAADESKRQGGKEVTLESVLKTARAAAKKRLEKLDR
ncbi:MAG: Gfo/Idh/MocA family oxidoreductase [Planctomycetaceae bacterium]